MEDHSKLPCLYLHEVETTLTVLRASVNDARLKLSLLEAISFVQMARAAVSRTDQRDQEVKAFGATI
jgi:hypothetical protein